MEENAGVLEAIKIFSSETFNPQLPDEIINLIISKSYKTLWDGCYFCGKIQFYIITHQKVKIEYINKYDCPYCAVSE